MGNMRKSAEVHLEPSRIQLARAEWNASSSLRAEFGGEFERYLGWVKANEFGLAQVQGARGAA